MTPPWFVACESAQALPEIWPHHSEPSRSYNPLMTQSLDQIVSDFAAAMFEADRKSPVFVTRTGRA